MQYSQLGQTPYRVSRICFGALTIGPLQANLSLSGGAAVIRAAMDAGINFIDTAQMYRTYPYIREALKSDRREMVIATKCYAYSREEMAKSLEMARQEMNRDRIEIFELHEQESELTIRGHWPAIEYLLEAKAKGLVGAIGISTHTVAAVRAAAAIPEIEVVHPMINVTGLGILDGSRDEMLAAIGECWRAGKGIYGMKAIGGGNLISQVRKSLDWAYHQPHLHSVAVGMKSAAEVRLNAAWLSGEEGDAADRAAVKDTPRQLHIDEWCTGCGACLEACSQGALRLENGRTEVDQSRCLFCGYCAAACRDFCIKVV